MSLRGVGMLRIEDQRAAAEKLSLEQIRAFLQASEEVQLEGAEREEIYGWISRTLQLHGYRQQPRANRGLLRRYLEKLTGLSRAQVTRLIRRYLASGEVKAASYRSERRAHGPGVCDARATADSLVRNAIP